jgi:uncharacterized protein (TIGR00369 family)
MSFSNQLRRTLARLDVVPDPLHDWVRTYAIGRTIPYVGTSGLSIDRIEDREVQVSLPNKRRVQNHIGTVHAAAVALVLETATGLTVGMNVHDDAAPVLKTLHVDYLKRTEGGIQAVATLSEEQAERLRTEERGEVTVPVTLTDEAGAEPVEPEMVWAWTPKR